MGKNYIKPEPHYNEPEDELHLFNYSAVSKHKSIRRAIRKQQVTKWGAEIPKRPFNNSKRTRGRKEQLLKERLYGQISRRFKTEDK